MLAQVCTISTTIESQEANHLFPARQYTSLDKPSEGKIRPI